MHKNPKNTFSVAGMIHRFQKPLLILLTLVMIAAVWYLPNVRVEASFSKFFPEENVDWEFYQEYTAHFGGRDDILSVGIRRSEGIFEPAFLREISSFADSCRTLPLVKRVHSLMGMLEPRKTPFGFIYSPLVDLSKEGVLNADSLKIVHHPMVKGRLMSPYGDALLVVLELEGVKEKREASQKLLDHLDTLLSGFAFEEAHIVGAVNLEMNQVRLTSSELRFFIQVCIFFLIIVLLVVYRSLLAMIIPLVIFLLSMISLGALLALVGISLDTISNMLPTILLIVSISDVIHMFDKMRPIDQGSLEGLIAAVDKVAWTNLLTSLTTAIGFFTLIFSPMPTLVDFGISVGLGVMIAYLLSTLLVPLAFFLFPAKIPEPRGIFARNSWQKVKQNQILPILNQPKVALTGLVTLLCIAVPGIRYIDYDRFLMSTMPVDHEIRDSYRFFEERFNGSREFEIAISTKEEGGLGKMNNLVSINRLQMFLDSMEVVGGTQSPATVYKVLQNIFYPRRNKKGYELPEEQAQLDRLNNYLTKKAAGNRFRSVLDSTLTYGAIRGHMKDIGMLGHQQMIKDIDQWIDQNIESGELEFRHTGIPMLLDRINILQLQANFTGLAIAAGFVSFLIALLFRNWLFVLVMVAGNLLPLLLIAGLMGYTGITMRGSTSLIFSVAFVIILDDTIHLLSNFLQHLRSGHPASVAMKQTIQSTGHAIFLTTIILASATLALTWSSLPVVKNLGFLLSVALLLALIFDLVLIPALLMRMYKS